jgi:hypothetical protein
MFEIESPGIIDVRCPSCMRVIYRADQAPVQPASALLGLQSARERYRAGGPTACRIIRTVLLVVLGCGLLVLGLGLLVFMTFCGSFRYH